jgi:hypothetical protein
VVVSRFFSTFSDPLSAGRLSVEVARQYKVVSLRQRRLNFPQFPPVCASSTTPQGPAVQGQKIARPLAESRASRLQDAAFEEGYCPTGTTVLDHNKLVQSAADCVPSEMAKKRGSSVTFKLRTTSATTLPPESVPFGTKIS